MSLLHAVFIFFRTFMVGRAALAAENLVLRQQLAVLRQSVKRPKLRRRDRVLWVWLSWLWRNRRSVLVIGQPDTVGNVSPRMNSFSVEDSDGRPALGDSWRSGLRRRARDVQERV